MAGFLQWPEVAQPLPRLVRPIQDETITSYTYRLSEANFLDHKVLQRRLQGRRGGSVRVDLLATLSGQPTAVLRYAILELCTNQELATMSVGGRPQPGGIVATKCTHCMAARGIDPKTRVGCWRRSEDVLCRHHCRWTAGTHELDLFGQPSVLKAQRQHQKLIRHHGRRPVLMAFYRASDIIDEWHRRGHHRDGYEQRMKRFLGPTRSVDRDHPAVFAARYPQIVALTRLLVSSYWRALALSDPTGNDAFVAEVRRTIAPDYRWNPNPHQRYTEPLVRFYRYEQHSLDRAYHHGLLDLPIDTIEPDELCHDHWDRRSELNPN
jgi:hypothetical protein